LRSHEQFGMILYRCLEVLPHQEVNQGNVTIHFLQCFRDLELKLGALLLQVKL